jgi:hypothetical protein
LEGKVFLWDVPSTLWQGWGEEHLEIFEIVAPRPGMYRLFYKVISCYTSRMQRFYYSALGKPLRYHHPFSGLT